MRAAFVGAAGASLPGALWIRPRFFLDPASNESLGAYADSPIAVLGETLSPGHFTGDHPARAHAVLWDKAAYLKSKGGIPEISEHANIVIAGGGLSGLASAYSLKKFKPILLEQAPQFGGNAKGEQWGGLRYSIGSAYMTRPEEGSPLASLLKELGLLKKARVGSADHESVVIRQTLFTSFWDGVSDPTRAEEFRRVARKLKEIHEKKYPSIPFDPRGDLTRSELEGLDRMSFAQWMQSELRPLHPHIAEFFHQYCWDSMAGSPMELSAAQALNFITADFGGMFCLPGGNSALAEAMFLKLQSDLPAGSLRSGSFVLDVALHGDGVRVCYETADGNLKSLFAKKCIVSAPKFIARVLIDELPQDQERAVSKIKYRAFLVANILVRKPAPTSTYGVFDLREAVPVDAESECARRGFSSLVFANWATQEPVDRSVLTLFKAFPFDGGRSQLFAPGAWDSMKERFEREIPRALSFLGLQSGDVVGLRISRWGHALPLAGVGLFADGTLEKAHRPIANRIYFAQQDNWANPCVESAISAAFVNTAFDLS